MPRDQNSLADSLTNLDFESFDKDLRMDLELKDLEFQSTSGSHGTCFRNRRRDHSEENFKGGCPQEFGGQKDAAHTALVAPSVGGDATKDCANRMPPPGKRDGGWVHLLGEKLET